MARFEKNGRIFAAIRGSGFILPVVLILLAVLVILGAGYLTSTIQSKNVFQVFYRDDLARMIAESTVSEWRATFYDRLSRNSAVSALLYNPKRASSANVEIRFDDVPKTAQMARRLLGAGQVDMKGVLALKDIDDEFVEIVDGMRKVSSYGNEYQGTIRFEITVALGEPRERKYSRFAFEFDVKNACLRTDPSSRLRTRYTNNSSNDYVLFARNGLAEFVTSKAASVHRDRIPLKITRDREKGKIYFGTGMEGEAGRQDKFVFFNVYEGMEFLLPPAPQDVEIPWAELKELMPTTCQEIETILQYGLGGYGDMLDISKLKGAITREYTGISGCDNWFRSQREWTQRMMEHFFRKMGSEPEGNKEKCIDFWSALDRGASAWPFLEGNLRKRFWQTSVFRIDFSDVTTDPTILDIIKKASEGKAQKEIPFATRIELGIIPNSPRYDEKTKEMYKVVNKYQEKLKIPLMSQPNDQFSFLPGFANQEQNGPGRACAPPFHGRTGPVDAMEYLPYATYLLRSYRFADDEQLYSSPFYDVENQVIHLDGIMLFENPGKGVVLRPGLKYRGQGVILSYGPIIVQGSFTKDPADKAPGPCVLYTFRNNIYCNALGQGQVQASLVALNFRNVPGSLSGFSQVHFNKRRADVLGNIAADVVNLSSMEEGAENRVSYDAAHLSGEDLYHLTLGGRVRLMSCAYNMAR